LFSRLSDTKIIVIDDSQNLLISKKLVDHHFLFMSWLVNMTNVKVLYLGTLPFQELFSSSPIEYQTILRRSLHFHFDAS
jgi:hypothetical protein